ncbi:hypothetical protein Daus18300_010354 [Diaporthe australafricana]|uniref:Cytochrome P450 n=1 Tax=Diaporthe australafricana TaxID=127596 RepID=A0ABR3WAW4_9PEZI
MDSFQTLNYFPQFKLLGARDALSLVSVLIGVAVLSVATKLVYNAFFHPVAKFPGPLYAGATKLSSDAIFATGHGMAWLRTLHDRYGPVVRYAPDTLSFIDPQAWKDIYGHQTMGKKSNPKHPDSRFRDFNGVKSLVSELEDDEHGRIRRIVSHAFSDRALRDQQPLLTQYVDQLIGNIHRDEAADPEREYDAAKLFNFTTFDIMADLTFGEPLGLLKTGEYTEWVKNIFMALKTIVLLQIVFDYSVLEWFFDLLFPSFQDASKTHFKHSSDRVDKRLEAPRDQPDIWNRVLSQPEGRQMTVHQMYANADLFMIAGTETTATLVSGLTYLLCKNPDKMKRLAEEIRSLSQDELNDESLPNLQYLGACIQEALRCYPPAPAGGAARITPPEGNVICGEYVPGKTRVSVPQYPAFMSKTNFKDPESFIPERWFPGSGYDNDRKEALQPFSVGPRNCVGKNLAYREMRLIMSKVLWNFDVELCPQSENWIDQKVFILWEKGPLMVKMKPLKRD